MRAGGLQHPIDVQRKVQMGVGALKDPQFVWQNWLEGVLCEIEVRRGKEQFDQKTHQRFSEEVYRFRVRLFEVEGLDATMRVVHESQNYDIKAILPDIQNRNDCIIECTLQDGRVVSTALLGYLKALPAAGATGQAYSGFEVTAQGGRAPYAFSVASGALPAGLALNSSTGAVSGTPTMAGVSSGIVLRVTDAARARHDLPPVSITIA